MPCFDGLPSLAEERADRAEHKTTKLEAMLCGVVRAFGVEHVSSMVNWKETGVTKEEFEAWWKDHQHLDTTSALNRLMSTLKKGE